MTDRERAQSFLNTNALNYGERYVGFLAAEFAAVRAEEREACAKVADEWVQTWSDGSEANVAIAAAIRARGKE